MYSSKKKYEMPQYEILKFDANSIRTQSGCVEGTISVIVGQNNQCKVNPKEDGSPIVGWTDHW